METLDSTFAALADPTRRAILACLAEGEASVGELSRRFPISQPAVSRHLKVLEDAQLIVRRIDQQRRVSRLRADPLRQVSDWLETYRGFWEDRFDALDHYLKETSEEEV